MPDIHKYYKKKNPGEGKIKEICNFLHQHLEEYGDSMPDIRKAIDYAMQERESFGGMIVSMEEDDDVLGAVVINKTGMSGYIPENILVYIATHKNHRGEGIGKKLMNSTIAHCDGDIALHVEANNPAVHLYKKVGFTNPYLEMRLSQ